MSLMGGTGMIEPWNWTLADLQQLIKNGALESLTLDYKACSSLTKNDRAKNELSKDISSFANATGGTIVYGVQEGKGSNRHLPISIEEGFDPQEISREWLESVINSNIRPRVDGIRINPILLPNGNVVYVVYVPQSLRAPHMASDNRYYKRFNFQSVPMEDYEVRDVMNRSVAPDLEMIVRVQGIPIQPGIYIPTEMANAEREADWITLTLDVVVVNHSPTPAEYAVFDFFFGEGIEVVRLPSGVSRFPQQTLELVKVESVTHLVKSRSFSINHGIPGRMPIWSGLPWSVAEDFRIRIPRDGFYQMGYRLHSPRMEMRFAIYSLHYDGQGLGVLSLKPEHLADLS